MAETRQEATAPVRGSGGPDHGGDRRRAARFRIFGAIADRVMNKTENKIREAAEEGRIPEAGGSSNG